MCFITKKILIQFIYFLISLSDKKLQPYQISKIKKLKKKINLSKANFNNTIKELGSGAFEFIFCGILLLFFDINVLSL